MSELGEVAHREPISRETVLTRRMTWRSITAAALLALVPSTARAACDESSPDVLACEDFEQGGLGWPDWYGQSIFIECNGCPDGTNNDPGRILLTDDPANVYDGSWSLHMPGDASVGYLGASMTWRDCAGDPSQGCALEGHEELYFRTWVKLAEDHAYVHHFLSISGTRPDDYWGADGTAGCRPNGYAAAGTTLDFNENHELFFYTYFPEMTCDMGGYCSGDYVQSICDGCAAREMPCDNGLECCWGNLFGPAEPLVLPRGEWVCLELMMRLNTPGEADGAMAFWMNDELGHEQTGMHWRDVPELQLNKAWLQHYIDQGDTDQSNRAWFDDVVVSTQRIGCGDTPPGGEETGAPSEDGGSEADAGDEASSNGDDGTGTSGSGPGSGPGSSGPSSGASTNAGDTDGAAENEADGCGCRAPRAPGHAAAWLVLILLSARRRAYPGCPRARSRRASLRGGTARRS